MIIKELKCGKEDLKYVIIVLVYSHVVSHVFVVGLVCSDKAKGGWRMYFYVLSLYGSGTYMSRNLQ